jgi:preprotein translocase subunit SecD
LYQATDNDAFNLEHCWGISKDTSKWQAVQAEIKSKSTKKATQDPKKLQDSSSVHKKSEPSCQADNPDEEEEELANKHEQSLLGSDGRPEVQKAAKQKQTNDDLLDKVLKTQEELLKISKDRSDSIKEAMQNASDDHIMAMNLLGMDEESTQYWQKKSDLRLT